MKAEDDALVQVKPMLDRVPNWESFLSHSGKRTEEASIKSNSRTGRPMGGAEFIQHLETLTGRDLAPKKTRPQAIIR
jgi:putative transposase